jgi:hypothetical protein
MTAVAIGACGVGAAASAGESRIDTALLASAQKAVPSALAKNQLVRALESGLWNSNRTAVAISITEPKASLVFVFISQADGTYLAADASGVEGGNFGKLGRPRTDYDRVVATRGWLASGADAHQSMESRTALHGIRAVAHQA